MPFIVVTCILKYWTKTQEYVHCHLNFMLFFAQSFAEADIKWRTFVLYMYSTVTNRVRCMNKKTHWRQEEPKKIIAQRNRILLQQRQRIIQAFEDVNEDYFAVAATIEQIWNFFSIVDCYCYTHVCQFTLMIDHFEKRLYEGAIDCASLCKLHYCMSLIRNWLSYYAIDFLLVLMINHCARLKAQRCNCSSVDAIEC